jgi:signal transduction histidine kinase
MAITRPAPLLSRPPVRDLGLALLVAALSVIGGHVSLVQDAPESLLPMWGRVALLVIGSLALALRGPVPVAVLVMTAAVSLTYQSLGYRPLPLPLAVLVALYTLVLSRPLLGTGAAALYLAGDTLAALGSPVPLDDDHIYTYLVAVVATVTLGYGVALGRARARLAEQRAIQLTQEHDARTRAAVEQEQARIAREVHDIVAHDVSVIVAQARAARAVLDQQPEATARSLASIESVGRDALDGLRRLMGLLRTVPERDGRPPQPRLVDLPRLVDQVRRAGLPVELTIRGHPRPLPATLELNAYRVVQEALTNSLKHAGPTSATVVLTYTDDSLLVEVTDGGHGTTPPRGDPVATGFGLVSMRQRVAMHGGDLDTRTSDGQGFHVAARFPMANGMS